MFNKFIRFLFLVKEIVSKTGEVHFRRYRLLQTPWFAIYIHHILASDKDSDLHDHPWHFESHILKGSYSEEWTPHPLHNVKIFNIRYPGDVVKHHAEDAHRITLNTNDVWTLVFTSGREREWGYQTKAGWIAHKEYRQLKNEGKLQ